MTIAGKSVTVSQDASPCSYTANPEARDVPTAGNTGYTIWVGASSGRYSGRLVAQEGEKTHGGLHVVPEGECCYKDGKPTADFTVSPDPVFTGETVSFTDQSSKAAGLEGAEKTTALGFSWTPINPEIGQDIVFTITGVGAVDSAAWDFGEDGCGDDFGQYQSCVPAFGATCLLQVFSYASAGDKTVKLTINGNQSVTQTVSVLNQGSCDSGCTYSISPTSNTFGEGGGTGTVSVSTQDGCAWTASEPVSWIIVNSGSGSGSGSFSYDVLANSGGARTATIDVEGIEHTVSQDASPCNYTVSPEERDVPASGNTGYTIWVGATSGCSWTAISSANWVRIQSGTASGTGNGQVKYDVDENELGSTRSATITIGGQQHTINQEAPDWKIGAEDGIGNSNNTRATVLVEFGGSLFVGTENSHDGCEIWRADPAMTDWDLMIGGGLGNSANTDVLSAVVFDGWLYIGTANSENGGELWRSSDGTQWTKTALDGLGDSGNTGISAMAIVGGDLYLGTENSTTGAEVWRSSDGANWAQINFDGFGNSSNDLISAITSYESEAYAASTGFWGARVWKKGLGLSWDQVAVDGFGDNSNERIPSMVSIGGTLYAGTENSYGGQIWRTGDGTLWDEWCDVASGDYPQNTSVSSMIEYQSSLVFGIYNWSLGSQVWQSCNSPLALDGFFDQYNTDASSLTVIDGVLFVGTENPFGLQVWSLGQATTGAIFRSGFENGGFGDWSFVAP